MEKTGSDTSKCIITLLQGALVGGVVMFLYLAASWMLMPWHKNTTMSFKNDAAVTSTLAMQGGKSGIYIMPGPGPVQKAAPAAKTAPKAQVAKPAKPFAFVAYNAKGFDAKAMKLMLFKQFVLCLLGAMFLTHLLKKSAGCGCPVSYSMVLGLLIASLHYLPNVIWYHFPVKYSLVGMIDDFLAITLAGAFISKCILNAGACTMGKDDKKSGCCR